MTAPAPYYVQSHQTGAGTRFLPADPTTTLGVSLTSIGALAGDLCVIVIDGLQTSGGTLTSPTTTADTSSTAFATDATQITTTNNGKSVIFSRVLIAGDLSSFVTVSTSSWSATNNRCQIYLVRDASGFDASRLVASIASAANIANSTAINWSSAGAARRRIAFAAMSPSAAAGSFQFTWDGSTTRDPYCDESGTQTTDGVHGHHYGTNYSQAQSDWNGYDTGDTPTSVTGTTNMANTSHAFVGALYIVSAGTSLHAAKAPAAASAKADQLHQAARLSGKSPAAASAKADQLHQAARLVAKAPAAGSAKATVFQTGRTFLAAKTPAAASAKATLDLPGHLHPAKANAASAAKARFSFPILVLVAKGAGLVTAKANFGVAGLPPATATTIANATAKLFTRSTPITGGANVVADAGATLGARQSFWPAYTTAAGSAKGLLGQANLFSLPASKSPCAGAAKASLHAGFTPLHAAHGDVAGAGKGNLGHRYQLRAKSPCAGAGTAFLGQHGILSLSPAKGPACAAATARLRGAPVLLTAKTNAAARSKARIAIIVTPQRDRTYQTRPPRVRWHSPGSRTGRWETR